MTKKDKQQIKLPDIIIPIKCSDKEGWSEKWYPGRNLLNIVHSFRAIIIGNPNSGKSTSSKNICLRADPPFEEIYVIHYSDKSTEWDDFGVQYIQGIPDPHEFDQAGSKQIKRLIIFEDIDTGSLSKQESSNLNRLVGYTSSHCSTSIIMHCQNPTDCPVYYRRLCNLFILYRCPDLDAMAMLARRTGIKAKEMMEIFDEHINHPHGSLWLDISYNTPAKMRIDGYKVLEKLKK